MTGRIARLTHILIIGIEVERTSIQTFAVQQLVVGVTYQTSVGVKTALTGRITLQTLAMFICVEAMLTIRNTVLVDESDTGRTLLAYIIACASLASLLAPGDNELVAAAVRFLAFIESRGSLVDALAFQGGVAILAGETLIQLVALIAVTVASIRWPSHSAARAVVEMEAWLA